MSWRRMRPGRRRQRALARAAAAFAAGWFAASGATAEEGGAAAEEGLWASEALADGADIGRIEYMAGCAQCHGISGRGDGIIADFLTVEVPDLTVIQRDNQGVFPAGVIYEIIATGGGTGAHGSRQMPAWGDRYSAEAYSVLGWPHEPEERAAFIRSRILALGEYLASIQVE